MTDGFEVRRLFVGGPADGTVRWVPPGLDGYRFPVPGKAGSTVLYFLRKFGDPGTRRVRQAFVWSGLPEDQIEATMYRTLLRLWVNQEPTG